MLEKWAEPTRDKGDEKICEKNIQQIRVNFSLIGRNINCD